MSDSKSNLLNYISRLMHDDGALQGFIEDPITEAEQDFGLTKAERSVLRRVVAHLSNNSLNGYSMSRTFSSYRRSLRLLQNVLKNVGTKMYADLANLQDNSYHLVVYAPLTDATENNFTCKTNADVNAPFARHISASVTSSEENVTIKTLLDKVQDQQGSGIQYGTSEDGNLVTDFTLAFADGTKTFTADLTNSCYD